MAFKMRFWPDPAAVLMAGGTPFPISPHHTRLGLGAPNHHHHHHLILTHQTKQQYQNRQCIDSMCEWIKRPYLLVEPRLKCYFIMFLMLNIFNEDYRVLSCIKERLHPNMNTCTLTSYSDSDVIAKYHPTAML